MKTDLKLAEKLVNEGIVSRDITTEALVYIAKSRLTKQWFSELKKSQLLAIIGNASFIVSKIQDIFENADIYNAELKLSQTLFN